MRYEIEGVPSGQPLDGIHEMVYDRTEYLVSGQPVMIFRWAGRSDRTVTVGGLDGGGPVFEARLPRDKADRLAAKTAQALWLLLDGNSKDRLGLACDVGPGEIERWLRS
jgi:hypothetical protein